MSISTRQSRQRVVIVGPGAMGCLFAGCLSESGSEVWLLDKDPVRVELLREQGVRIEGIGGTRCLSIPITHQPQEIGTADFVFIWVKSYDTRGAAEHALPLISDHTQLVSLQNGLGNLEALAEVVGANRLLGGTTSQGATLIAEGHVRHAGAGPTRLGAYDSSADASADQAAQLLDQAGFPTHCVPDVTETLWHKLVVNAAINPLTAITRLRNGQLLECDETHRLLRTLVKEVVAVADAGGIALGDDVLAQVEDVCRATAPNISSMLQDVLKGSRTEIDAINGAVVDKAIDYGVPVPLNQTLAALVKATEFQASGAIEHEPIAQPS